MIPPGDFLVTLFKQATGALLWPPEVVMHTPIPQLIMAIEGRYEFAAKTNPFGGGTKKPEAKKPDMEAIKRQRSRLSLMRLEARQNVRSNRETASTH